MVEDKPWKSFEEQLAILKGRGLQVDDDAAALNYLDRLGYYRLSGYWYPFRKFEMTKDSNGNLSGYVRSNDFMDGSRFEDAVKLYRNMGFRSVIQTFCGYGQGRSASHRCKVWCGRWSCICELVARTELHPQCLRSPWPAMEHQHIRTRRSDS